MTSFKFSWMAASQRQLQTYIFLRNSKSVFTWDFTSGEIKYFHFGILSIPKRNSSQVLFHCGHFDRNEISFRVIKYVNATRNEIIWKETSAHAWTKLIGPYIMGRLYRTSPKTKFVSFRPQWKVMWTELVLWWVEISFRVDFILGLMQTTSKLHIFYISYCDVMLKRNKFLWVFFK